MNPASNPLEGIASVIVTDVVRRRPFRSRVDLTLGQEAHVANRPRMRLLGCAASLALIALPAPAQTRLPGVKAVPQPAAPPAPPATRPSLGTLNPTGLNSQFPAGLPSPGDTPAGSPAIDAGVATPGAMGGAGAVQRPAAVLGAAGYTAQQIAGSFIGADLNRDGELTRAEAQRLTIAPYSFEEMDRNHDGVLTRFEYEDAVR